VQGSHFVQEESPDEIGDATARFVAKMLVSRISSTESGQERNHKKRWINPFRKTWLTK
jgi:hypothetical protein